MKFINPFRFGGAIPGPDVPPKLRRPWLDTILSSWGESLNFPKRTQGRHLPPDQLIVPDPPPDPRRWLSTVIQAWQPPPPMPTQREHMEASFLIVPDPPFTTKPMQSSLLHNWMPSLFPQQRRRHMAALVGGAANPPVFDAVSTSIDTSASTTLTFAHTCTGTNRALIVMLSWGINGFITNITATYNGVAMALVGLGYSSLGGLFPILQWKLSNPASGSNNVVITATGGNMTGKTGIAVSFTNAHQTTANLTGTQTYGTLPDPQADPSIDVTSGVNEIVVDGVTWGTDLGSTMIAKTGQTEKANGLINSGISDIMACSLKAGASSVNMSWTRSVDSSDQQIAGFSVKAP